MKLLAVLFFALGLTTAHAQIVSTPELGNEQSRLWEETYEPIRIELEKEAPVDVLLVRAPVPTPTLTGYYPDEKRCVLAINLSANLDVTPLEMKIVLAHEAGHCVALRTGYQQISDGLTRGGEGFADAYSLAWIAVHDRAHLQQAVDRLLEMRMLSRRFDPMYNTLIVVRVAGAKLLEQKEPMDPLQFTQELMKQF